MGFHPGAASPTSRPETSETPTDGLSLADWSSIRAAHEAGRHAFEPDGEGWRARNPGQQWTTCFDGRRFLATPDQGGWNWGLELQSYGVGDSVQRIDEADDVVAEGRRLAYRRGDLEEWWINDERGLEHGFIVAARPVEGAEQAPLTFSLATLGGLKPQVEADRLGVVFRDAHGVAVLTYGGLKVWDARGRILPSHFEMGGGGLLHLLVDDREAVYPVTVDPVAQQAYLKAGNTEAADEFGSSVAVSGNTVVVGAINESSSQTGVANGPGGSANNAANQAGAAYVFVRSGAGWIQQAYLKAHNTGAADNFGWAVAIDGDTLVVGAPSEDSARTGVTNGSGGANDNDAESSGAAYVFVRSGSAWNQQAYLKAGNAKEQDFFGSAVSIAGDTVVVAAPYEDSAETGVTGGPGGASDEDAEDSGAVYVFARSGTTWSQQAYLKAGDTADGDLFGNAVSLSGETLVVGAPNESSSHIGVIDGGGGSANSDAPFAGAAYVFVREDAIWRQQAYLKAGNTAGDAAFGTSAAISGDTLVIGAFGESSNRAGVIDGTGGSRNLSANSAGAAYVFVRENSAWKQQAYLKPGVVQDGDNFGWAVAISGDAIVVGAPNEGSALKGVSTGPGGTPDEYSWNSGAAYFFRRSGSTWRQQAYLKAGNAKANAFFGFGVALSGNLLVTGATGESSVQPGPAPGAGGGADEGALNSGAAYLFDLAVPSVPARITLSRPRFSTTPVGRRSLPQTITATNVGGTAAKGLMVALSGAGSRDFVLSRPSGAILAPGAFRQFRITFAPKRKGRRSSVLIVRSSAPEVRATLTGQAK